MYNCSKMSDRFSDDNVSKRDVPSFIEPLPPLISNPFMRPRPQKATNLLKLFEEDSECEEPELVQVYLRLKPCNIPSNLYEVRSDRSLITSLDTTTAGHGRRTQHNVSKMYTFSHIFRPDASQKEIFEHVVKDNLKKLPEGHSFTLLTYGASGSGKTYTLMGTVASPGLVPRSLEYVFRVVDAAQQPLYRPTEGGADKLDYAEQDYELRWVKRLRQISAPIRDKYRRMSAQLCNDMTSNIDLSNRTTYYVWVSFVEIYNEAIYDLLVPGDRRNATKLHIREDTNGNVYVKGATQAFVRSGEEAYDVLVAGKHQLQVAATGVHAHSSRSHCIFTITMLTHTASGVRTSSVRLCDLAGCERARRTRNTGARMAESRAINSSLHVLERCLHSLRRRQRNAKLSIVPYRESKLTRLLGAGLSGAKGEAVSMVVTLNPSPEYAQETKHVLQLAAVAKDIQINNTVSEYPSSLESSQSQDSLDAGFEIMRLRADNERLHFELVQAHNRITELKTSMEEKQATTADTMRSLVEEAQEITRTYYEEQMQALRNQMEEMAEEYEERLSDIRKAKVVTPNRALQNKVTQLMTELAIVEEKLTAEQLARARAEEEVQHLRACIEERDENAANDDKEVMSLSDSDNENNSDEEDHCNESLEPTFTKEDINKSRLIKQSLLQEKEDSLNSTDESNDSVLEKSTDTVRDSEIIRSFDSTYIPGNETEMNAKVDVTEFEAKPACPIDQLDKLSDEDSVIKDLKNIDKEKTSIDSAVEITNTDLFNKTDVADNIIEDLIVKPDVFKYDNNVKQITRGTYFVDEPKILNLSANNSAEEEISAENDIRKSVDVTYVSCSNNESLLEDPVKKPKDNITSIDTKKSFVIEDTQDDKETTDKINQWEMPRKASDTLVSKIISSLKSKTSSNSSLAQFEQLEQATRDWKSDDKDSQEEFCNINVLKEKRTYFADSKNQYQLETSKPVERKTYFDNNNDNIEKVVDKRLTEVGNEIKHLDDFRSPSIVKEIATNDFEPSTIKKLLGESMTRQTEPVTVIKAKNIHIKKNESLDVFESPIAPAVTIKDVDNIEKVRESIERIAIKPGTEIALPAVKLEQKSIDIDEPNLQNVSENKSCVKEEIPVFKSPKNVKAIPANTETSVDAHQNDNTLEEFEKIYKDVTVSRATEFDLLVSQEVRESHINEISTNEAPSEDLRYNLRHKSHSKLDKTTTKDMTESKRVKIKNLDEEVLLESVAKSEMKQTRRNLRLRRRKNVSDDDKQEEKPIREVEKLKDIVNLQNEFSDVTIDVPAPVKTVKDIPSPEIVDVETENLPPSGIQSCPSKSITRSRRKLFTPRAEPLEESLQGESGERVRVPRPSYHKPRARRKL